MSEQHRTKRLNEFKELENIEIDQYLIGIDDIDIGNGARIKFDNFVDSLISSDENNKIILGTDNKLYNLSAINLYSEDMVYKNGEWVLGDVDDERNMYESLQDDNIGNALSDEEYWKKIEFNTSEIEAQLAEIQEQLATKVELSTATSASLPSTRVINLTLGATGTSYTAPADGWIQFSKSATAVGQYILLLNSSNQLRTELFASTNTQYMAVYIPVRKGDTYRADYTAGGSTSTFRFIYAEGAN